jgi:hypothetical protein
LRERDMREAAAARPESSAPAATTRAATEDAGLVARAWAVAPADSPPASPTSSPPRPRKNRLLPGPGGAFLAKRRSPLPERHLSPARGF